MHPESREFTLFVKQILSDFFINKRVLDICSGENNRVLFENCKYDGNDVIQADNITIVSKTKDLPFIENTFDTIISTEYFQHDPEYKQSFIKIYNMLKPDGLFCFTCASIGRSEHGTRRTSSESDYYKNLTEIDVTEVLLPLNKLFSVYEIYYNSISSDLYFVGIKKGTSNFGPLKKYVNPGVVNTLSNTDAETDNTLNPIFNKYDTDKKMSFHNYTRQYDKLLNDFRDKPIKYLEIGVCHGGSVKAFRETFVNAICILGLDINNDCKKYENIKNNIFVEIGDATNASFINNITEKYGSFDIILDDGSHTNRDVISSFELLFPLLNDNGLYIVEDTICYKSYNHINPNYLNHLQYFFNYTQYLNQWRYDSTEGIRDHCIDPFKIMKKTTNVFEYSIDKIEYGCSYIAISKKIRKHWI